MKDEEVRFGGEQRDLDGYLVLPDGERPHPALIVIQEIWGVDDHIRDVCRRFAQAGYAALAPDLYTGELKETMRPENIMAGMAFMRQAPPEVQRDPSRLGAALAERTPEERRALTALMSVMSPERRAGFARDLVGAFGYLASRSEVDPERIGSLGFCLGGGLSFRLATLEPRLQACVVFYGENPPVAAIAAIQAPVLGLYGAEDMRITDSVPDVVRHMAAAGKSFEHHIYEGAPHAFFNDTRPTYRPEAAGDAWSRTLAFLELRLGA
ncbi:MAG TPA: dienelactone hydrolase family protein [Chloroflexota bacterium]|nr:dienelactone hydrolase family protein [Chloroflexota bacterium]